MSYDMRNFEHEPCERCGTMQYGGSHYHCANCTSTDETSMLGHYYKDFVDGKTIGESYFHCKAEDVIVQVRWYGIE